MSRPKAAADVSRHSVYVVRLSPEVLEERRFREENPQHVPGAPCVYVGVTGLTPEERFRRHKDGIQACGYVREFGECLVPELYDFLNPMPYAAAVEMEQDLAEDLRAAGYAVWQR